MRAEERRFVVRIKEGALIHVRMRRDIDREFDWAAVLTINRIRDGVKLEAEPQPSRGSARLDLPATIEEIKGNWKGMVERWL